MEMSSENLEYLYERLIRQRTYKGDTCPAEHVLVAYQAGFLGDPQRRLLVNHFQQCSSCKEDFIALERAGIFMEPGLAGRTEDPQIGEELTNRIDWSNRTAEALNAYCNKPEVAVFLHSYRQPLPGEVAFFSDRSGRGGSL